MSTVIITIVDNLSDLNVVDIKWEVIDGEVGGTAQALGGHLIKHLESIREQTANAVTDVEPKE